MFLARPPEAQSTVFECLKESRVVEHWGSAAAARTPADPKHLAPTAGLIPQYVRAVVHYSSIKWLVRPMAALRLACSRVTNTGAAFLSFGTTKLFDPVAA
jgi:hypothetical protein